MIGLPRRALRLQAFRLVSRTITPTNVSFARVVGPVCPQDRRSEDKQRQSAEEHQTEGLVG
jgi:hypothetical protein